MSRSRKCGSTKLDPAKPAIGFALFRPYRSAKWPIGLIESYFLSGSDAIVTVVQPAPKHIRNDWRRYICEQPQLINTTC
jgi:hypothetical protein